jgi:hypothetical protein
MVEAPHEALNKATTARDVFIDTLPETAIRQSLTVDPLRPLVIIHAR